MVKVLLQPYLTHSIASPVRYQVVFMSKGKLLWGKRQSDMHHCEVVKQEHVSTGRSMSTMQVQYNIKVGIG